MVNGVVGAILSVAFWASWGGAGAFGRNRTVVTGERTVVSEREVV